VSGTDTNGDKWTLTLYGPGTLNVVDSAGNAFTKDTKDTPDDINTITVSGTVTSQSRLVGKVTFVPTGSDGRVFFQHLTIDATGAYGHLDPNLVRPRITTPQNGIAAVDMPNFWLGNASGTTPDATARSNFHPQGSSYSFVDAGGIDAPEGINTLRFGGVDTTFTPAGGTPLNQTNQNNEFVINLGPPLTGGTSIIVNKVITDASSTTSGTTTTVHQQSVTFFVGGRINLFQANEIDGNTTSGLVPTQFVFPAVSPSAQLPGGTYVVSEPQPGTATTTGQIGNIRIGGNATNFTAFALANDVGVTPLVLGSIDPAQGPQVSNFFIGGETNNVILVAPAGSRNVYFGRGMDNTFINTEFIQNLQANRGAIGSAVTVKRNIGNLIIGGDVVNTLIQSGYDQYLSAVASNVPATVGLSSLTNPAGGVFNGAAPPTILNRVSNAKRNQATFDPLAHNGGEIHGRIAGNVTNSIVSASVDPSPFAPNNPGQIEQVTSRTFPFGAPENIVLPRGAVSVKVEGTINNSAIQQGSTGNPNPLGLTSPVVDPTIPSNVAFFAKHVKVEHLPVIPPNVPEAPYPSPVKYGKSQSTLKGLFKIDKSVKLPSGPARHKRSKK
jgi:hypothetical protein